MVDKAMIEFKKKNFLPLRLIAMQTMLRRNILNGDLYVEESIFLHGRHRKEYGHQCARGNSRVAGEWSKGKESVWLFEHHNLMELEGELSKYGQRLGQSHHMFLPKARMEEVDVPFAVQWFEQEDIQTLYGRDEFPNALCDCFKPERPDVLAAGAMYEGQMVGLAGCSADAKLFWQIGIDVLPEWRGKGIATMLVKLLKNEVFRRGAIPFYGTSLSNIGSWKVALGSGFYPMWVEIETTGK